MGAIGKVTCECFDLSCPVHPYGIRRCYNPATTIVRRIDMDNGDTRFVMCDGCAQDALDSGVFA